MSNACVYTHRAIDYGHVVHSFTCGVVLIHVDKYGYLKAEIGISESCLRQLTLSWGPRGSHKSHEVMRSLRTLLASHSEGRLRDCSAWLHKTLQEVNQKHDANGDFIEDAMGGKGKGKGGKGKRKRAKARANGDGPCPMPEPSPAMPHA